MTGKIVQANIPSHFARSPGGEIRFNGCPERIRFVESELVGVTLADCLNQRVDFDISHSKAVRVRRARDD